MKAPKNLLAIWPKGIEGQVADFGALEANVMADKLLFFFLFLPFLLGGCSLERVDVTATGRVPYQLREARSYHGEGLTFLRQGETEKAIEYLTRSLGLLEFEMARAVGRRGYLAQNPLFSQSVAYQRILTLNSLGTAHRRAGNTEEAVKAYESGISIIQRSGLKTEIEAAIYNDLGQLYLQQKNFPLALKSLQKALEIAEGRGREFVIQLASSSMGNLFLQTQRPAEALRYYRKSVEITESNRSFIRSEEERQSYFEERLDAYRGMVDVLFLEGKEKEAFNYTERARSRGFLDVLGSKVQLSRLKSGLLNEERALRDKIAILKGKSVRDQIETEIDTEKEGSTSELQEAEKAYDAFLAKVRQQDKEQASLMAVEPSTVTEVQELLDPATTLIEYFVTLSDIYVWAVEKDRVQLVRVPLPKKELSSLVKALRDTIFTLEEKEKFREFSLSLYRHLIQPVLPHIGGKELMIVPHDVLHYVPFHALLSPEGRYLIERYPIYYLSSASLLQFTKEKRKAKGDQVLALGNPDLGDPKMNLEFAELEAKEIRGLYPQSTVLLRRDATEQKGKTLSPQHDIIHFATHAELREDDPLSSAILLAKDGKEDGRLEVKEIFGMDLKAGLVVLSACETGLGKLSSGDELVGLTRAFIYAGTPSVVASLWKVEDSSTAALMASFYKNLKTMTKVEALRQAQLGLIKGEASSDLLARRGIGGIGKLGEMPSSEPPAPSMISTSHPYFWAPFILVGEGK